MKRSSLIIVAALLLAACGAGTAVTAPTPSAPSAIASPLAPTAPPVIASPTAPAAMPAQTSTPPAAAAEFDLDSWDSVLAAARGQTVNWYMWGGSESINTFVDTFYGKPLAAQGITLRRVPVADTVDAVNQVLSEQQAGKNPGVVDVIWINGENFGSLKQAKLLYSGWTRKLPNSRLVDWENPALNLDFGQPIEELESPWSSAQFQFVYDSARTPAAELPNSYNALKTWACAHQGRFTYIAPGPGAFQGTRFVKGALYELSGGAKQWSGSFNQALWDQWSPKLWAYLNELKPCLWRAGATYPKDENELHSLFANSEVDFSITQAIAGAGPLIKQGLVPTTARAFVFEQNMIGDFNYLAIPSNAPHKAAALVLANLVLDPALQAAQILPDNGFGLGYGIDVTKIESPVAIKALEDAAKQLGPAATDARALAAALVGDAAAPYQNLVEQQWQRNVLQR